ncbi:hypothetical protein [Spirillospora sp. CA-294931]|uniref:hypothetical protein n=1 Tax=Spirillospora sp. CA-294931 TaxID=3240042 RepID=UPI003D8E975E
MPAPPPPISVAEARAAGARPVTRARLMRWEGFAWTASGAVWVTAGWPGAIIGYPDAWYAGVVAASMIATGLGWRMVRYRAPLLRPRRWVVLEPSSGPPGPPPTSARLKREVVKDALYWSAFGVAWPLTAYALSLSETIASGVYVLGSGLSMLAWGWLCLFTAGSLGDDGLVVRRRYFLGSRVPVLEEPGRRAPGAFGLVLRAAAR